MRRSQRIATGTNDIYTEGDEFMAGQLAHHAGSSAPSGWLKANGAAVSRAAYATLFAAIGVAHGAGDGSTTFNLPDCRGEFLRGLDDGRGVDTGRTLGSAQAGQNAAHSHGVTDPGHSHYTTGTGDASGGGGLQYGDGNLVSYVYDSAAATGISIQSSGGTETRPRNVAHLVIVKY